MINVYYSTQSGTSEHLSQMLTNYLRSNLKWDSQSPLEINLNSVSSIENFHDLELPILNIFFISSYGDGEPCDDAVDFFTRLESLKGELDVNFTVFGCGNSQYDIYQAMALKLNESLLNLCGKHVGKMGFSDESKDIIDDIFNEWLFDYLNPLCKFLGDKWSIVETNDYIPMYILQESKATVTELKVKPPYHDLNPFMSQLDLQNTCKVNDKILARIPLEGSNLKYTTGDHIGIIPRNSKEQVESLLQKLNIENIDQVISITPFNRMDQVWFPKTLTYRSLFTNYIEINSILSRQFVKGLLKFLPTTQQPIILDLISDRVKFQSEITNPKLTLLGFLTKYALAIEIPLSYIIENFGKLKSRYFSISSSNIKSPKSCDVVIKLVSDGNFEGVLSSWIDNIVCKGLPNEIPIFTRKSKFKLPFNLSKPIVLIGAGTGIAPFLGYLVDLNTNAKRVRNVTLIYGLKSMEESLIDLESVSELGDKLNIIYALSQESTQPKRYVQDVLLENADLIIKHIKEENGSIFVCGNAMGMAHGVSHALIEIFAGDVGDTKVGNSYLQYLKAMGRFKEDVW